MNRATWSSRQTPRARDQSHYEDLEDEQNILNYWVPQVSKHDILKVHIVVHGAVVFVVKMVGFRHFPSSRSLKIDVFLLYLISDFSWFIFTSTIVAVTLLFFSLHFYFFHYSPQTSETNIAFRFSSSGNQFPQCITQIVKNCSWYLCCQGVCFVFFSSNSTQSYFSLHIHECTSVDLRTRL